MDLLTPALLGKDDPLDTPASLLAAPMILVADAGVASTRISLSEWESRIAAGTLVSLEHAHATLFDHPGFGQSFVQQLSRDLGLKLEARYVTCRISNIQINLQPAERWVSGPPEELQALLTALGSLTLTGARYRGLEGQTLVGGVVEIASPAGRVSFGTLCRDLSVRVGREEQGKIYLET